MSACMRNLTSRRHTGGYGTRLELRHDSCTPPILIERTVISVSPCGRTPKGITKCYV